MDAFQLKRFLNTKKPNKENVIFQEIKLQKDSLRGSFC